MVPAAGRRAVEDACHDEPAIPYAVLERGGLLFCQILEGELDFNRVILVASEVIIRIACL